MRKKVFGRQLARGEGARRALFRSQIGSLIEYGHISTTTAKAKSMAREVDHLVNLAKQGTTASLRNLYAIFGNNKNFVKRLHKIIAPVMSDRSTGYTRMIKLVPRKGDSAAMTRIEWVNVIPEAKKEAKEVKAKKVKTEKPVGRLKKLLGAKTEAKKSDKK
jgi:large subunit ribosomal protein L17